MPDIKPLPELQDSATTNLLTMVVRENRRRHGRRLRVQVVAYAKIGVSGCSRALVTRRPEILDDPIDRIGTRLISSQSPKSVSATQISFVPGRKVKRDGLLSP
jgi:hypothetical protein